MKSDNDIYIIDTYVKYNDRYEFNDEEFKLLSLIADRLECDSKLLSITKTAESYTTLKYRNMDLLRLQYNDNYQEISIFISNDVRKKEYDNSLFDIQKNKNQVFWKSKLENLFVYYPFISSAIKQIDDMIDNPIEYEIPSSEIDFTNMIISLLNIPAEKFKLKKTNQKHSSFYYISDEFNDVLLFNFKYTSKAKWIEFPIDDKRKYINYKIFADSDKTLYVWKTSLDSFETSQEEILKIIKNRIDR